MDMLYNTGLLRIDGTQTHYSRMHYKQNGSDSFSWSNKYRAN